MDGRQALTPGAKLKLNTHTGYVLYTVNKEVGRGGSCIVYDASYTDNLGNYKLVRIKECYPHALRITRNNDDEVSADQQDALAFVSAKERMIAAYQKNHRLFMQAGLTNVVSNTTDLYEANGTIYIVSTYLNGSTFAVYKGNNLHDCLALILGTAIVLQRIHDAGYLYLDLKPDNILTVEGSHDLVQLFDFDSMISMEELEKAINLNDPSGLRTSYTRGYAPLEQQTGKLKHLGMHTDIYSLGAVLFYALWHRTPTAFDCEQDAVFDFASIAYPYQNYQDKLFRALTEFFHKTLASYHLDRYQDASDAIAQLQKMLSLADETKPWLHSTSIQINPAFYGRETELHDLSQFLSENAHHTCSLYGMGGIGKSTLVRRYLFEHLDDWDAHLWLYGQGKLMDAIADDTQVQINTLTRENEEITDEYLKRKLLALGSLAKKQHILVVIDNFIYEHINQLEPLSKLGITILLISRERLPDGLFPSMQLAEMEDNGLASMFAYYSHCDLTNEENFNCFQTIISSIDRHTLLTELIARQVAKSYLSLQVAEAMVAGLGLSDFPDEKIDYVRDQTAYHGALLKILDRLIEIDRFTAQDKLCMKLLSLFDMPGIEADLFKWMASLTSLDFVNDLEAAGWLKAEQGRLYLHPMMQEYVHTWSWDKASIEATDRMMRLLYERIRPAGKRHDGSKQFPKDYGSLYRLLKAADQLINHTDWISEASQRLLFRMLMDAPMDQDTSVLFRMLDLLKDPRYLDDDSILRLYENAAYFRARLYAPEDAVSILGEMKRYLLRHPSAYYLSAYHRAMAVILHNADEYGKLKKCLQHEDKAIAAVRLSTHPDAKKQLAASLLDKATTLLSTDLDRKQARKLIMEAKPLVEQYAGATDYETYQYACTTSMCFAMDGDLLQAEAHLKEADDIAFTSPDSDLAIAEHLIEQAAPIRIAMEMYKEAADAVLQAIALCDQHSEAIRYRETRFDAYLFLGRIYAMGGEYIKGEEAFAEAEKLVADSPYEWKLPLCPEDILEKAKEERNR